MITNYLGLFSYNIQVRLSLFNIHEISNHKLQIITDFLMTIL